MCFEERDLSTTKQLAELLWTDPALKSGIGVQWLISFFKSSWAYLHVVGMLRFLSDINQPGLPTPFYSVLVSISVFMALSTVFHSIYSPDNSVFSVYSSGLITALLVLSTVRLFMKVSFSPDIIPSG